MAFRFCDGFDAYSSSADMSKKWDTNNSGFNTSSGRFGGGCFGYTGTSAVGVNYMNKQNLGIASGQTIYIAGYVTTCAQSFGADASHCFIAVNGLVVLAMNGAGQPILVNNSTTAIATGTTNMANGGATSWHWLEFALKMNGSSSTATCYVDGILQFSGTYALSSFPAATANTVQFAFPGNQNGGPLLWDDTIIWDDSGTTFNTFPLGPRRIGTQNPNGAGASTQFTPSAGANYSCVSQGYSGSANVSDAGTGNTDTYAQSALGYTPQGGVVNAVVVNTYAYNPAGDGTRSLTAKLRSSGTNANGATRTLPANLSSFQDCFTVDSSSAAWTVANVNAAQPGIGD